MMCTFVGINNARFFDNSSTAHEIWDSEVFLQVRLESTVMNSVFVKRCVTLMFIGPCIILIVE